MSENKGLIRKIIINILDSKKENELVVIKNILI